MAMRYRRWRIVAAFVVSLWLGACESQTAPAPPQDVARDEGAPSAKSVLPASQRIEAPKASAPDIVEVEPQLAEPLPLCWQDYCPCDPVETTTDKWICRNLRAGVMVPDDVMALGAMQRDSERSIRAWNRDNPDYDPISIPALPDTE
jgi:hypothetical protein